MEVVLLGRRRSLAWRVAPDDLAVLREGDLIGLGRAGEVLRVMLMRSPSTTVSTDSAIIGHSPRCLQFSRCVTVAERAVWWLPCRRDGPDGRRAGAGGGHGISPDGPERPQGF